MQTQMIRIERNAKMEAAIERCRKAHPKVRRVDSKTVTVYGSKGDAYTVTFAEPKPGLKLAACNCPAGRESKVCYHLAAALAAPIAVAVADEKSALCEFLLTSWSRIHTRYEITLGLVKRFGVVSVQDVPLNYLRQMAAIESAAAR